MSAIGDASDLRTRFNEAPANSPGIVLLLALSGYVRTLQ